MAKTTNGMVIGNGVMGKAFWSEFLHSEAVLIFASGVSNSKTKEREQFERERDLLTTTIQQNVNKLFVYFSTCSIYDPAEKTSSYVQHKLLMENIVKANCKSFLIFRISNVVGNTNNKTTVFNFLVNHIAQSIPFKLWKNAYRNIIDVDDIVPIVSCCILNSDYHNQIINVANLTNYSVPELVNEIEFYLGKKAIYTIIDEGAFFEVNLDKIRNIILKTNVNFSKDYVQRLLCKYYSRYYND